MGLASNGLCVEIVIRRFPGNLSRFGKMTSLGGAKSGSLDLVRAQEGLGSSGWIRIDVRTPKNLLFPYLGHLGVSSGLFSHIIILFGGFPWAPIGPYWLLLAPIVCRTLLLKIGQSD